MSTGYRIIDLFTEVLIEEKNNEVFLSFSVIGGILQLFIATTTFGIGIDSPDMRRIVYWGIPISPKEYVQQTGSSGRDENPSLTILYEGKEGKVLT